MGAVDVGIGHDHNLVIAQFRHVRSLGILLGADRHSESLVDIHDLVGVEDLMVHGFLYVQDLAAQRKDGLIAGITALLCRTAGRISLHEEEFAFHGIAALAGSELAGESGARELALVLHAHAGAVGRVTRLSGEHHFVHNHLGLLRMLLEIIAQSLADGALDNASHLVVAEFCLCLSLELGLGHLHRYHGRQTVAEVLFRKLYLELFEESVVLGVFLEGGCQTAAEAGKMRSSLDGVDIVDVGIYILVEIGVVGHGHLDGHASAFRIEMDDILDERFLPFVDIFHEFL